MQDQGMKRTLTDVFMLEKRRIEILFGLGIAFLVLLTP